MLWIWSVHADSYMILFITYWKRFWILNIRLILRLSQFCQAKSVLFERRVFAGLFLLFCVLTHFRRVAPRFADTPAGDPPRRGLSVTEILSEPEMLANPFDSLLIWWRRRPTAFLRRNHFDASVPPDVSCVMRRVDTIETYNLRSLAALAMNMDSNEFMCSGSWWAVFWKICLLYLHLNMLPNYVDCFKKKLSTFKLFVGRVGHYYSLTLRSQPVSIVLGRP